MDKKKQSVEEKLFEEIRLETLSSDLAKTLDSIKEEGLPLKKTAPFKKSLPKDFLFNLMLKAFDEKGNPLPEDIDTKEYAKHLVTTYGDENLSKGDKAHIVYSSHYSRTKLSRWKGKAWPKIFSSEIYSDEITSNCVFIDLVTEENNTQLKDAKHLQELTGIDKNLMGDLEQTLTAAREYKLSREIEKQIVAGVKYKDLISINPKDFGLPKTWKGFYTYIKEVMDIEGMVLQAIMNVFSISKFERGPLSVRDVANHLEAPYSVILEATK